MPAAPRCLFRDLIFSHRPAAHLFPRREERDLFVDAVRGLGLPVCLKSDETAKLADPHACRGVRRRERGHDAERPTDVAVVNRARAAIILRRRPSSRVSTSVPGGYLPSASDHSRDPPPPRPQIRASLTCELRRSSRPETTSKQP